MPRSLRTTASSLRRTHSPAALGPRRRRQLRPDVESLESRALLSFTAALSMTATAGLGGSQLDQQTSTSNPGTISGSWEISGENVSTQGSASFQTTDSSLIMDANAQSTEQLSAFSQGLFAETQI
jgi:hypothetical protein